MFHKLLPGTNPERVVAFPPRTITVAVTARRIGEEQGGEVGPEILLQEFASQT